MVFPDHNRLGAVNDGLRINDGPHLLVGLHVNGLRRAVDDRALIIHGRGGDIDRGRIDCGSRLVAPIKSRAVAEGESPGIGVGGCGEGRGECGEDKEFFHSVGWWLKVRGKRRVEMVACQIGGLGNQYFAIQFLPFKELELPFIPRNRPLAGNVRIGVF